MTVRGKHGVAQASEKQVCIIWDGCLFFFPRGHLDGIVSLLQALQQEIALKEEETGWQSTEINGNRWNPAKTGV